MTRQLVSLLLALIVVGAPARVRLQSPVVTVGPNVRVSAARSSILHGEGLVVADPTNSRRLLVCAMIVDDVIGQGIVTYTSSDGGRQWAATFETPAEETAVDPACAFGPDGTAYLVTAPRMPPTQSATRVYLFRSDDGGRTWQRGGLTGFVDRESIVVDGTGGRFHNRVYIHGSARTQSTNGLRRGAFHLYTSTDGGRTFGRPATKVSLNRQFIFGAGNSVVLSDGRWVAVFGELKAYWDAADSNASTRPSQPPEPEDAWLKAISSDDGGDSLSEPVTISGWHMPNAFARRSIANPTIAADATKGPFRDRLYVVWPDTRFGGTDILFSYSADGGRSWSRPFVMNDDRRPVARADAPNHLLPAVAVNAEGVVGAVWLDRRDAADNLGWRVRFRASRDGGETFLPSVVVSEAAARFDGGEHWPTGAGAFGGGTPYFNGGLLSFRIVASRHLYIPGDYSGLAAAADGTFFPYWIDNRTGWHQVWTAPISVEGVATVHGSPDLAALDDVTALTTLRRVRSAYDAATHTASVVVQLTNTSKQVLRGPFKIRLVSLSSDLAIAEALATTNGVTGPGAVWDATSLTGTTHLEPGGASRPLTLAFRLHDVRPFIQGDTLKLTLVDFSARVLGRLAPAALR